MLDRPLWRDWIFYLWLIGLAAGVMQAVEDHGGAFGLVFDLVVQTIIFWGIPAGIRAVWRSRKGA